MLKVVFFYFFCVNLIAFVMMVLDKWYAVKHMRRIPENVLLGTALIGGGVGFVSGMVIARHKLSKLRFRLIGPISILMIFALVGYLVYFKAEWLLS